MQRQGGHRILFHETWAQPVATKLRARALVMDQMGEGDSWPELQGTVTLFLARYLHLDTNLWLNTDGAYLP